MGALLVQPWLFLLLSLVHLVGGVFRRRSAVATSAELLKTFGGTSVEGSLQVPASTELLAKLHDQQIDALANGQASPYCVNVDVELLSTRAVLKEFPLHIRDGAHPVLGRAVGLNMPSFYLGSQGSYSEIHEEDGVLDSVNALHWGAPKLWLIVRDTFAHKLSRKLKPIVDGLKIQGFSGSCGNPIQHKVLVVTSRQLLAWGIPHEVVVQYPGDILYVREGVPHQVINLGVNLAEAVNVGGHFWARAAKLFRSCGCAHDGCIYIESNPKVLSTSHVFKVPHYPCPVSGCEGEFRTKELLIAHQEDHKAEGKNRKFCSMCPQSYRYMLDLKRHVTREHLKVLSHCPKCDRPCHPRRLGHHVARCGVEIRCPQCGRVCANGGALARHVKSCVRLNEAVLAARSSSVRSKAPNDET